MSCSVRNYTSQAVLDYVMNTYGPPCSGTDVQIVTVVIYVFIFVAGVVGNLSTVIIIVFNYYMHSATNFYLTSLAISDLLSLLLGIPFELDISMNGFYPTRVPTVICKIRGFISETTSYASVLTVTAFALERWLAICHPLKHMTFSKRRRVTRGLVAIWIASALSASPMLYYVTTNTLSFADFNSSSNSSIARIPGTELCGLDSNEMLAQGVIFHASFWLFFLVPICVMTALFAQMFSAIHRSMAAATRPGSSEIERRSDNITSLKAPLEHQKRLRKQQTKRARSHRMFVRMLVAVVAVFFVCWLPFHIQRLAIIHMHSVHSVLVQDALSAIFFVSGYFYYANAAINPVVYNAFNRRFRHTFIRTIFHCQVVRSRRNHEVSKQAALLLARHQTVLAAVHVLDSSARQNSVFRHRMAAEMPKRNVLVDATQSHSRPPSMHASPKYVLANTLIEFPCSDPSHSKQQQLPHDISSAPQAQYQQRGQLAESHVTLCCRRESRRSVPDQPYTDTTG